MTQIATRVGQYVRISNDKAGDEHGVANQDDDCDRFAKSRNMVVVGRYRDNDLGASSGKLRPDYNALMQAAARREFDAILVWQTSRLWRNRRERAEAIEILRRAGVSVIAVKGPSLDMSTAYGRALCGLLGEFDTLEAEVKSERQQLANSAAARAGKRWTGSPRPFGFKADHVTHEPAEAQAISDACVALLRGSTVSAITREWNARGLRPPQYPFGPMTERPWKRHSVLQILRNPANAGLATYLGEHVGTGKWKPIVPEETWRAVNALLSDPSRKRNTQGIRTLLGGLALCPCGNTVSGSQNQLGQPVYRCTPVTRTRPGPHVAQRIAPVDEHVESVMVGVLSKPEVHILIAPPGRVDVPAYQAEAAAIRVNLDSLAADRALGVVTRSQLLAATERGQQRLDEIAAALAEAASESVLAPFLACNNAEAVWAGLDQPRKRAVIRALCESVTIAPAGRGRKVFDPDTVIIEPKEAAK